MSNYKVLPKWAQKEIEDLKSSQSVSNVGANVQDVNIEFNAVKHSEHTASAIQSMCDALMSISEANINSAKAVQDIAKSLKAENIEMNCGNGVSLTDIRP